MKEAVSLLFDQPPWGESFGVASQQGRRGDRWETRQLWTSTALNHYLDWPGQGQVCCVERTRKHKGRETVERSYAIISLPPGAWGGCAVAGDLAGALGIKNRLHWVRDVVFGKDQSQVRTGTAP